MGDRYIITVECPRCSFIDDEVPFAPTCGYTEWECPKCEYVVDLIEETGITYEDASSIDEINMLIDTYARLADKEE